MKVQYTCIYTCTHVVRVYLFFNESSKYRLANPQSTIPKRQKNAVKCSVLLR